MVLLRVLPGITHTPEGSWKVTSLTRLAGGAGDQGGPVVRVHMAFPLPRGQTGFLLWGSRGSVLKEWKSKAAVL